MRHLCLSMKKPLLAEFKIHNLIISRITSKKTAKPLFVILEILQPLQVIPEISSSSSWHLFHESRNGAAPTKLIQENFFQKQLVIVVLVVLWCSCTQTDWCLCQNCSKASQSYQGWRRKTEAFRQQVVKHVLKRDSTFGSLWKTCLAEAVLHPHKHVFWFPRAPARTLQMHLVYICIFFKKMASAFSPIIFVCACWA